MRAGALRRTRRPLRQGRYFFSQAPRHASLKSSLSQELESYPEDEVLPQDFPYELHGLETLEIAGFTVFTKAEWKPPIPPPPPPPPPATITRAPLPPPLHYRPNPFHPPPPFAAPTLPAPLLPRQPASVSNVDPERFGLGNFLTLPGCQLSTLRLRNFGALNFTYGAWKESHWSPNPFVRHLELFADPVKSSDQFLTEVRLFPPRSPAPADATLSPPPPVSELFQRSTAPYPASPASNTSPRRLLRAPLSHHPLESKHLRTRRGRTDALRPAASP